MHNDSRFGNYSSYVMTAYAQFIEAAGARVVPLVLGEPREVTLEKLSKLNGVLFPGGDGDYLEFGRFIFE
jgi:gamma-glutamyl hydrolase